MTTTDRAAAEHRGISAAAGIRLTAAAPEGCAAAVTVADLDDNQRTYLGRLVADARAAAEQRSALDERLAYRSVRAQIAVRLADAYIADDERTVAMLRAVYAVASAAEDATRPAALLRAV